MIHLFESLGSYFAYDVYSGALHMPDKLAYDMLGFLDGGMSAEDAKTKLSDEYTKEDIEQTYSEIEKLKDMGLIFSEFDYADVKPLDNSRIKAMCLHIAHDCNLRCKYCFASKGAFGGKRSLMSFEVGKKALDFLVRNSKDAKVLEVDFFGGEPLMNIDTVKMLVAYARKVEAETGKQFKFTLTTNAYELDEATMDFLNREMYNVVISLDGRPEVHDFMRPDEHGVGSHEQILENARKFVKMRGDKSYYIRGTFTHNNLDFGEDVKYFAEQGFEQMSIEPVVADPKMSYSLKPEDMEKIKHEYEGLAKWYMSFRRDKFINFFHFMINLEDGPCLIKRLSGCGAGFEYVAVTPEGDIYPCHQYVGLEEMKMATVDDDTINREMAKKFAANNVINKPGCQQCWAQFWCGGGCGANAYKFNGDLNKPYAPECEMLKKRLECAMAIYALEKEE